MRILLGWGLLLGSVVGLLLLSWWYRPDLLMMPVPLEVPDLVVTNDLASPIGVPTQLVIPRLDIDVAIQSVGIDDETGSMDVPSNFSDTGWYNGGSRPGEDGSAVIAGHRSGRFIPRAVFYDLHTLEPGASVFVRTESGQLIEFVVRRVEVFPYDADTDEVFASDANGARLNLITCSGTFDAAIGLFSERVVVFTEYVRSVPVTE